MTDNNMISLEDNRTFDLFLTTNQVLAWQSRSHDLPEKFPISEISPIYGIDLFSTKPTMVTVELRFPISGDKKSDMATRDIITMMTFTFGLSQDEFIVFTMLANMFNNAKNKEVEQKTVRNINMYRLFFPNVFSYVWELFWANYCISDPTQIIFNTMCEKMKGFA
tara:strand:- start:66 stop:560 length:495 start_codon:yes stop_codon:yes gene_type:complete